MNPKSSPAWILAGWLLAAASSRLPIPAALPARIGPEAAEHELLERGSVRELCAIRGLGARRAQALVSARSAQGALPPLEDIPGIGPKTAETLNAYRSLGLHVSGVADPGRQGLSTTNSGQGAPEAPRAEALKL